MRIRPFVLAIAAVMLSVVPLAGCTADGGKADVTPPQQGLAVGTVAPDFRLKNQEQTTVALSDYKGEKNVILVFYPADFTPV